MNIFVVHASHRLTDHAAHGDGLIVWGFIETLAAQGHRLWVAGPRIDIRGPKPAGVHFFELPLRSKNKALRMLEYIVRSRLLYERLARSVHFDVVHQFNPVVRGYSFGMAFAKTPLVLGPYNGDWPAVKQTGPILSRTRAALVRTLRTLADLVLQRQASGFLITTPNALNRLPGLSPQSLRIHVVPNGIDDSVFAPHLDDADTANPSTILMVGCATHKGIFTMLEAFDAIGDAIGDAKLIIAGGGPQSAEADAIARRSRHASRIALIGGIARERMPGLIAECDIVAVPSFGEPYGMVVLEAMASGKPVVASDAGGIPFLLGTQETLFAPGDHPALAEIIIGLLRDPARARTIGAANRRRVVEQFTWEAATTKLVSAYEAVRRRGATIPGG